MSLIGPTKEMFRYNFNLMGRSLKRMNKKRQGNNTFMGRFLVTYNKRNSNFCITYTPKAANFSENKENLS
jgi:hypothetical protein